MIDLSIPGWMTEPELNWLAEQARRHQRIAEIGAWQGRSTVALADTPGTVCAIDTWAGSSEHQAELAQHPPDWLWRRFRANTKAYPNILPLRAPSLEAAKLPQTYDMIFIDASHEYAEVKADIEAWSRRLEPGGLFCGHDLDWPDVYRAVTELLPEAAWTEVGSLWVADTHQPSPSFRLW